MLAEPKPTHKDENINILMNTYRYVTNDNDAAADADETIYMDGTKTHLEIDVDHLKNKSVIAHIHRSNEHTFQELVICFILS